MNILLAGHFLGYPAKMKIQVCLITVFNLRWFSENFNTLLPRQLEIAGTYLVTLWKCCPQFDCSQCCFCTNDIYCLRTNLFQQQARFLSHH